MPDAFSQGECGERRKKARWNFISHIAEEPSRERAPGQSNIARKPGNKSFAPLLI
jgi:hypothetical protein